MRDPVGVMNVLQDGGIIPNLRAPLLIFESQGQRLNFGEAGSGLDYT